MKRALLYFVLFIYTTTMLKPVFPYLKDTIAHIFWYSEHMATVHFENGKFHIHKEVLEEAKKTANEKSDIQKKALSQDDYILSTIGIELVNKFHKEKGFCYSAPKEILLPLSCEYPPPRA